MRRSYQEFLGVDVGDRRVGIARGSTAARLAEPLKTVEAHQATAELASLAEQFQIHGVVIGLPRSLDGHDTAQTEKIRRWVKTAQAQLNKPFYWQDEALTSVAAERQAAAKAGPDAVAASVILQDFLDTPSAERIRC